MVNVIEIDSMLLYLVRLVKCVLNTPNIRIMEIGETTPFVGSSMSSKSTGNYFKQFFYPKTN